MDDYDRVVAANAKALYPAHLARRHQSHGEAGTSHVQTSQWRDETTRQRDSQCHVHVVFRCDSGESGVYDFSLSVRRWGLLGRSVELFGPSYLAYMNCCAHAEKTIAAAEKSSKGIRCNCICPSWVRTPMFEEEARKVPQTRDIVKAVVPNGRLAEIDEVGNSVVYLCSPAASCVTGIGLMMDAGLLLKIR